MWTERRCHTLLSSYFWQFQDFVQEHLAIPGGVSWFCQVLGSVLSFWYLSTFALLPRVCIWGEGRTRITKNPNVLQVHISNCNAVLSKFFIKYLPVRLDRSISPHCFTFSRTQNGAQCCVNRGMQTYKQDSGSTGQRTTIYFLENTHSPDLADSLQVTVGSASGRGSLPVCMHNDISPQNVAYRSDTKDNLMLYNEGYWPSPSQTARTEHTGASC